MMKQDQSSEPMEGGSEGKPTLPEFVMVGVPSEFPNFSNPLATRWIKFRKVDVSLFIYETDGPDVVLLKHRLIKMASEEIQILKHPDNHSKEINNSKESFRIEFEGILACLDLKWKNWEHEFLHPSPNNTFPNEAIHKIIRLQHDISDLKASDKDLGERMEKMNRYSEEAHKKGRVLGREVRQMISQAKVANFQKEQVRKNETERKIREQMRADKEAKDKEAKEKKKSEKHVRADKTKVEAQEEPGMKWEGGDVGLFDFGFGKK